MIDLQRIRRDHLMRRVRILVYCAGGVALLVFVLVAWTLLNPASEHRLARTFTFGTEPAAPATGKIASPPLPKPEAVPQLAPRVAKGENSTTPSVGAPEGESHLVDGLNAPAGNIQRDLAIVYDVLEAWLTAFPRTGFPVGENREITAALTGDNARRFAYIPRGHAAINARGELCDRWGTPFRFHQIGGDRMELRSAGPDRRFGTADDAVRPAE